VPTELVWDGKYKDGKKISPLRISLPFQDVETVNESAQERQKMLDLFNAGRPSDWRNRLIWGDKRYVLPSLLDEFAGKVDLIYIGYHPTKPWKRMPYGTDGSRAAC